MRTVRLAGCCLAAVALAACATGTSADQPIAGGMQVLAAETFLADMAQNVAGDRLMVESLLPPGVDPHEFQAAPRDAIKIAQARLLIINGLGYEAWLQQSLEASGSGIVVVEASAGLSAGPEGDPHLWMSARNAIHYAENIRDALSEADPAGGSFYAANAEVYMAELRDLDAWIQAEVGTIPEGRRVLITNHHALESFAEAYGFEIAGVVIPGSMGGAAPSAQQMAELIGTIESLKSPAIFLDVSENADLARQIASETGAQVVTGLYVETLSETGGPAGSYIDMLKHDVNLIVEALK